MRWGLRGDPILWQMMADSLTDVLVPNDQATLLVIVTSAFKDLTNYTLEDAPDHISVPATHRANGGMSRGMVSAEFWRETGLPLIISRWHATRD